MSKGSHETHGIARYLVCGTVKSEKLNRCERFKKSFAISQKFGFAFDSERGYRREKFARFAYGVSISLESVFIEITLTAYGGGSTFSYGIRRNIEGKYVWIKRASILSLPSGGFYLMQRLSSGVKLKIAVAARWPDTSV